MWSVPLNDNCDHGIYFGMVFLVLNHRTKAKLSWEIDQNVYGNITSCHFLEICDVTTSIDHTRVHDLSVVPNVRFKKSFGAL